MSSWLGTMEPVHAFKEQVRGSPQVPFIAWPLGNNPDNQNLPSMPARYTATDPSFQFSGGQTEK